MNTIHPLVRALLPIVPWTLQKVSGPFFKPREWQAVALSFVPPPKILVNAIKREGAGLDSQALLSPSYRRRLRNLCKDYVRSQLRNNPMPLVVQEHLLHWRQEWETAGYITDPARIRKLRDIEAETNDYYNCLAEEAALPLTFGEETVDGELLSPIVLGPVSSRRAQDIVSLLWEFATSGEGAVKPKITRSSPIYKILGIAPDELEEMTDEDALLLFMDRSEALLGLRGQPPEENNLLNLTRWVIRTHLPPEQEPKTTPEAMSKAVEAGFIHRPIKVTDKERREVVQIDVEDKSIVQPEDMLDLDDKERLFRFCELTGIGMNTLTDGESSRVLDILHALDIGYAFASKTGVSMAAYYGDKANSEKTQRQRLFNKIREASDKVK